jgi:hypothetical protein
MMPSNGGHGIYRKHLIPPGAAQAKGRKEAAFGDVVLRPLALSIFPAGHGPLGFCVDGGRDRGILYI